MYDAIVVQISHPTQQLVDEVPVVTWSQYLQRGLPHEQHKQKDTHLRTLNDSV